MLRLQNRRVGFFLLLSAKTLSNLPRSQLWKRHWRGRREGTGANRAQVEVDFSALDDDLDPAVLILRIVLSMWHSLLRRAFKCTVMRQHFVLTPAAYASTDFELQVPGADHGIRDSRLWRAGAGVQ